MLEIQVKAVVNIWNELQITDLQLHSAVAQAFAQPERWEIM